jgi:hypothetical protein
MEITSYNHHAKAPFFPASLVLKPRLPGFESSLRSYPINPSVHHGKYDRTDLLIHTSSGVDLALHASGSSPYFRRDEHVKVRYQAETGAILRVLFVSADGKEEGVFNGTGAWPLLFFLLVGLIVVIQGFRRYRRDPEGAEEPSARNQHPYAAVDERSLLDLSEHR